VGFADRATRRPSDPRTLYRIASITKTFTATAVMQLRDAGKLALDDPAIAYLPELAVVQSPLGPLDRRIASSGRSPEHRLTATAQSCPDCRSHLARMQHADRHTHSLTNSVTPVSTARKGSTRG
jgi:hypothetical protein